MHPSKFFDCDWFAQRYIVQNLICEWENEAHSEPRRGHAAFQLCICYLNGFGVRSNNNKAAEYLGYAALLHSKHAQHLFYRLQKYFSPDFLPNCETIDWLVDGMSSHGFTRHIAAQDLATVDTDRYLSTEAMLRSTDDISSCLVGKTLLDFVDLGSLQQAINLLPTPHDSIATSYQQPLLHLVATSGHLDAAALILHHLNLNINLCDKLGKTPLTAACQVGDRRMMELLISKGARYLPGTKEKISPLHYLLRFRDEDVAEVTQSLSRAGYPVDMSIEKSGSPLFWAASRRALRELPTGIARSSIPAVSA